jgi:stearoyl-CoA desaturase (delta-9 desaturase)
VTPHPNRLPGESVNYVTSIAFVAFHVLALGAFFVPVTSTALILLAVTYWGRVFFITGGYHRYFAHRTFKTSRAFQFVLAFGALTAVQKGPLWWAGHHRMHHRFTDTVDDAHSPIKGAWFSHVGWIMADRSNATPIEAISDFARYPELRFLNRRDFVGPWSLGIACFLIGGWSGLFIGFMASTVLVWHATFLVNSMSHLWGTRRYATPDSSRNNALVAFLTMGEGWHNNHHHIQSSARQGFRWWEWDPTYYILRILQSLHIVSDLRRPHRVALGTARLDDGAFDIGMFRYHWDKAVTQGVMHPPRPDAAEVEAEFVTVADQSLAAAEALAAATRRSATRAEAARLDVDLTH